MDHAPETHATERAVQRTAARAVHLVDVFVYVVVLNVATQLAPQIVTESFTTSVLVAILLKLVLEVVLVAKKHAVGRARDAITRRERTIGLAMVAVVLPGSKVLVLELVALVFGDTVQLGGFFLVTALIVTMLLARLAVRALLLRA